MEFAAPRYRANGINRVSHIWNSDCTTEVHGKHVLDVTVPYPLNIFERIRPAWWVLTGRAHAVIWPQPGDLEKVLNSND